MISKPVVSLMVAMALTTAGFAFAEMDGAANELTQPHAQPSRQYEARQPDRRLNHGPAIQDRVNRYQRREERGAGRHPQFRWGERFPGDYRDRIYVVDDWRGRNLGVPVQGFHWIQTGVDYVLVPIATGVLVPIWLND